VDLTLGAGQVPPDIDVLLDPGAQISGRVVDTDGNPIPNIRVAYLSQDVRGLSVHYADPEFMAATNENGEYKLAWVPSGAYYIRAELPGESRLLHNRTTFYPDSLHMANARRVVVGPGSDFQGLDIRVQKTTAVTVGGRVLRPDNVVLSDPPPELSLILYPRDSRSPVGSAVGRVLLDSAAGRFEIHGVLPGRYELAAAQGFSLSGRTFIDVGDRDIDGLSLIMKPSLSENDLLRLGMETFDWFSGVVKSARNSAPLRRDSARNRSWDRNLARSRVIPRSGSRIDSMCYCLHPIDLINLQGSTLCETETS